MHHPNHDPIRFVPDTEVVQHQLAQQELEGQAALSYEEYLRRLTQAVDTEVSEAVRGERRKETTSETTAHVTRVTHVSPPACPHRPRHFALLRAP